METGILLESGTNELEILEFRVGSNYYGINVAAISGADTDPKCRCKDRGNLYAER